MADAAESIELNDDSTQITSSEDKTKAEVVKAAESDVVNAKEHGENKAADAEKTDDTRAAIYSKYSKSRDSDPSDGDPGDDDAPEMVTVKINGEERQAEKAKVDNAGGVVAYQKMVAADERLRAASENQRILEQEAEKLREREAALEQREAALSEKDAQNNTPNDPPEKLDGDQKKALADKVRQHREALMEGEDEQADQIMLEIFDMARDSGATTQKFLDEIGDKAAQRALQSLEERSFEEDRASGVEKFNTDYEDIASDSRLRAMADERSAEIYEEHPDWSPSKIILEAARETREWMQSLASGSRGDSTSTQGDSMQQRRNDKRSISIPSSGSARKAGSPGHKVESNSEYIARLRKERGLE